MRWPWGRQVREQKQALRATEARRGVISSNWGFIMDQVHEGREHRRKNHITDLIMNVAKGTK